MHGKTNYSLRATGATRLFAANVPEKLIAERIQVIAVQQVYACTNELQYQGRIQQVAEGAQAPPCLGKIICLCLTHWQIEVKIEALSDLVLEVE